MFFTVHYFERRGREGRRRRKRRRRKKIPKIRWKKLESRKKK
jgi:hypothetical protein